MIRDGGGSVITPTNFTGQENNEDLAGIEISGIGEYTVELTATSPAAPGCPTTETKSFFYLRSTYPQNFSANEICEGDATTFYRFIKHTNCDRWRFHRHLGICF